MTWQYCDYRLTGKVKTRGLFGSLLWPPNCSEEPVMKRRKNRPAIIHGLRWASYYARRAEEAARLLRARIGLLIKAEHNMCDRGDIRRGIATLRSCADRIAERTREMPAENFRVSKARKSATTRK